MMDQRAAAALKRVQAAAGTERMKDPVAYNESVREAWLPLWVKSAAMNWTRVDQIAKEQNMMIDLTVIPRPTSPEPCIILGSGPSLQDVTPYLKDWKHPVFCSTSQLGLLENLGRLPDFCVYIDADPMMGYLISEAYRKPDCPTRLLTHVQIAPNCLDLWGGKKYFFLMHDPGDTFSVDYLPKMYGGHPAFNHWHVGSYVVNAGNVANCMVAIAASMGYGPIYLCGLDLGYPDGIYRYAWEHADNGMKYEPIPLPKDRPVFVGNNGVLTDELSCFYKNSFMMITGMAGYPVVSCSRGILSELPYVHPRELILENKQEPPYPPEDMYRIAQAYLKPRGIWILRGKWKMETQTISQWSLRKQLWFRFKFWWQDHKLPEPEDARMVWYGIRKRLGLKALPKGLERGLAMRVERSKSKRDALEREIKWASTKLSSLRAAQATSGATSQSTPVSSGGPVDVSSSAATSISSESNAALPSGQPFVGSSET